MRLLDHPGWYSCLGYCIAKERGQISKGLELCLEALETEPDNPDHFLNLGRVHLLSGDKIAALQVLREGMARGGSPEIASLLAALGMRKPPVLQMFSRDNQLNKYLGLLFGRLGDLIGRTGVDNDKLARRLQIERAAKHGVSFVGVTKSHHCGALGLLLSLIYVHPSNCQQLCGEPEYAPCPSGACRRLE